MQTVRVFSEDIGMEFGIEKCTMLVMEKGKIVKSGGIELPDGAGFGIRKTRACDNRTPRHEIQRLWTCERLHATHQVGVLWYTMIIPLRTP